MSIKFFYNSYNLDENKVVKIEIKNNKLNMYLIMNAHLELIANGYRPEMDLDISNVFIFNTYNDDIILDNISNVYVINCNDNEITFNVDYSEVQDKYDYYEDYYREYGHRGDISLVKNAIDDSNKAVVIGIYPEEEKYVTMTDMNGNEAHLDGGHMANVIYVDGNDIYIDTWGGIYKIDLEDLRENTWTFNFTSYELVDK